MLATQLNEEADKIKTKTLTSILTLIFIVLLICSCATTPKTQEERRRENQEAFFRAVQNGDYAEVNRSIEEGADVNAELVKDIKHSDNIFGGRKYTFDSSTALIAASSEGHSEIVKLLIEAGADVYAQDLEGHTALWWAYQYGHTEVTKLLFEAGAGVNIGLIEASRYGSTEVVKLLIEAGADVNVTDNDGHTALWWAYQYGHTEVVELLREAGAFILKH
jgi:ankyrin repeat protein